MAPEMGLDKSLGRARVAYWPHNIRWLTDWFTCVLDGWTKEDCFYTEAIAEKENLEALLEDCRKVLADRSLAKELLPAGFCAKDTDYNDHYFESVKETMAVVKHLLEMTNFDRETLVYWKYI